MTTLVDAPRRVDGVQLFGEMGGSGYRTPPALVRRADGQVLQLTPVVYLVLQAADGSRSCAEIAAMVGRQLGRIMSADDVRLLLDSRLRPLGLVALADGSTPELRRSNPLLRIRPRVAVTDPQTTQRLTNPFRVLFRPLIAVPVVVGFVLVVAWVFFERGLGASAYDAFQRPELLLVLFVVTVLSGGFHEFGHAAAARYGGAVPGVMGAGLYLVWPAFYTDVTASYRLGRWGRLRTDLGGIYFNAIVVVLSFVWWWMTGWEAVLLLVATQVLQMVHQLLPMMRYDGYHVLADVTGVPDLYHRIKPTLVGLLPHRWRSPENRVLKHWARVVITLWVLVTVPMMALMLLEMTVAIPRLIGSAVEAVRTDAAALSDAFGGGDLLQGAGRGVQIFSIVVPALGCLMILVRTSSRFLRGMLRWSRGSATKRAGAVVLTALLVTALSWAWWPQPGTYRPLRPGDHRLFTTFFQNASSGTRAQGLARPALLPAGASARSALNGDRPLVAAFPKGSSLPTKAHPRLALVLVPSGHGGKGGTPQPGTQGQSGDGTWVFPFDKPLPPGKGDNQALAVVTEDGSISYDVAFALVWAKDDRVLNVNEAHAYASCSNCIAVAVAFQVVLIMDDARVVVPQNLAVSANYQCYRCITAAIASQLVLSLDSEPGAQQLQALGAVWNQLTAFARTITTASLAEITTELEEVKAQIVDILGTAPPLDSTASSSSSGAPSASTAASSGAASGSPTPTSSAASASPSPSPEPSSSSSSSSPQAPSPSATATSEGSTPTPADQSASASPSPTP